MKLDRKLVTFLGMVLASIVALYYMPTALTTIFFGAVLCRYLYAKDEALWLAYFLTVSDGFFGFFGNYEAVIYMIPGLPGIEVGQIYIALTLVKALSRKVGYQPFYQVFLSVLGMYLLFLIVQGYAVGISFDLNVQFRIIKYILPFALFYSIPRLLTHRDQYFEVFKYLFVVVFFSLAAQVFTVYFKNSPMHFFGAKEEWRVKILINLEVTQDRLYRGIYNEGILLVSLFGALYSMASKSKYFSTFYLQSVLLAIVLCYFISATRGYLIGTVVIILLATVLYFDGAPGVSRVLSWSVRCFCGVCFPFPLLSFSFSIRPNVCRHWSIWSRETPRREVHLSA